MISTDLFIFVIENRHHPIEIEDLGSISSTYLCTAFMPIAPKSIRIQSCSQYLFTLLGSIGTKAARRMLMKLTPGLGGRRGQRLKSFLRQEVEVSCTKQELRREGKWWKSRFPFCSRWSFDQRMVRICEKLFYLERKILKWKNSESIKGQLFRIKEVQILLTLSKLVVPHKIHVQYSNRCFFHYKMILLKLT